MNENDRHTHYGGAGSAAPRKGKRHVGKILDEKQGKMKTKVERKKEREKKERKKKKKKRKEERENEKQVKRSKE